MAATKSTGKKSAPAAALASVVPTSTPEVATKTTTLTVGKEVTLQCFAPEASEVLVSGSFNNWSLRGTALKKDKTGTWTVSIPLAAGTYEYRYLVDGQWNNGEHSNYDGLSASPTVRTVKNPFGTYNCVLEVKGNA